MWALSTKFNPQFDLVVVPGLPVLSLDPGSDPEGMTYKMVIDATTPIAPEKHGHYSQELRDPASTQQWMGKIRDMVASAAKQGESK
jgi:4-hydroxybenzoate decarboxylase